MQFGICAPVESAADLKAAGADFVEENVQTFLQGGVDDSQWKGPERLRGAALPVLAANSLLPQELKIVGPDLDPQALRQYVTSVVRRSHWAGIKTLVFGSAGARNVPDGFSHQKAREQILEFLNMAVGLAAEQGITLVIEPLNRQESNIINSVSEAMFYVKRVNHPNVRCLVDSYHFWVDDDSLEDLKLAMPWIAHAHVADKAGRVAPGQSETSDYQPFFRAMKQSDYRGAISVEALNFVDFKNVAPAVISFLKRAWQEA
jgi:sugar phosphate isomerase/epimerase